MGSIATAARVSAPHHPSKPRLPAAARKEILASARGVSRRYAEAFKENSDLRRVAARLFLAGLQPRRRSGRPCDREITTAAMLFKRYRNQYPKEPYDRTWKRIYPVAIPGYEGLSPPSAKSMRERNLRAGVRSRRNARRRRRAKAK
jgi:hypothetical protein